MTQKRRDGLRRPQSSPDRNRARVTPSAPKAAVVSSDVLSGLKPGDNGDPAMHSPATVNIAEPSL